ncbi:MAG: CHAD domain-containing protein [Desulfuromonadales bacterium]
MSHPQQSKVLQFWDSFEWGIWFGGHTLYSCDDVYHLCSRDDGWLGSELCEERARGKRRFWHDFESAPMRTGLEEMLGQRALLPVAEATFHLHRYEVTNEAGKIVCRLEWTSVTLGERVVLRSCLVIPLRGYAAEAAHVAEQLTARGAQISSDCPLAQLLQHGNKVPQKYTLRPSCGLNADTPAREAVGRIVRSILEIAVHNIPGILQDLDTEYLHDYRICLRKIRSLLSLVKDVFPAAETRRIRTVLGDIARNTNRLRDLDVYLLARDEYLGLLAPELRQHLEGMFEDFSAEREIEVKRTTAQMRAHPASQRFRKIEGYFSEETRHKAAPASDLPVGPLVFQGIYKRYRKIRKIADGVGAETPDEVIHQIRIECKKLRYLMEFFDELIPREDGDALLKLLRKLQGRLGDFNDASVQRKSLWHYWQQKKASSDAALGVGGLIAILYHRQQQTRGLIEQELAAFCGKLTAATFKRTFKLRADASETTAP